MILVWIPKTVNYKSGSLKKDAMIGLNGFVSHHLANCFVCICIYVWEEPAVCYI